MTRLIAGLNATAAVGFLYHAMWFEDGRSLRIACIGIAITVATAVLDDIWKD